MQEQSGADRLLTGTLRRLGADTCFIFRDVPDTNEYERKRKRPNLEKTKRNQKKINKNLLVEAGGGIGEEEFTNYIDVEK